MWKGGNVLDYTIRLKSRCTSTSPPKRSGTWRLCKCRVKLGVKSFPAHNDTFKEEANHVFLVRRGILLHVG